MFSGVPSILPMGHLYKHTTAVEVLTTLTQQSSSHSVKIVDSHLFELAFRCSSHTTITTSLSFQQQFSQSTSILPTNAHQQNLFTAQHTHTYTLSTLTSHSHKLIFQIYTFLECEYMQLWWVGMLSLLCTSYPCSFVSRNAPVSFWNDCGLVACLFYTIHRYG